MPQLLPSLPICPAQSLHEPVLRIWESCSDMIYIILSRTGMGQELKSIMRRWICQRCAELEEEIDDIMNARQGCVW
jgi:hypothetical protein